MLTAAIKDKDERTAIIDKFIYKLEDVPIRLDDEPNILITSRSYVSAGIDLTPIDLIVLLDSL